MQSEEQAIKLFQKMLDAGLICHCSGEKKHRFICGFYLYYIVDKENNPYKNEESVDLEMFQKDWLEIEMSIKEVDETTNLMPFTEPYTQSQFRLI